MNFTKLLPQFQIMQKTGRNQLCPCGSGKKYKKCCHLTQAKADVLPESPPTPPSSHSSLRNLLETALTHQQAGRLPEAEALYKQVLKTDPNNSDAWHLLGLLAHQIGKNEIALQLIHKALSIHATCAMYSNLGMVLQTLGRLEEAIEQYKIAISLQPDYAEAYNNLASAFGKQGKLTIAVENYQHALALNPNYVTVYNNLGVILKNQGKLTAALANFQKALTITQTDASIYYNQGNVLKLQHKFSEAIASYRQALAIRSDYREAQSMLLHLQQHIHDWLDYDKNLNLIIKSVQQQKSGCTPLSFLSLSTSADLQLQCAAVYAATQLPPAPSSLLPQQPYQHPKIRIAYVSADFRGHAMSILMAGVFEQHDRNRFDIIAISLRKAEDSPLGRRVKAAFEQFIEVTDKSDYEVALLIRELEIDIAVDLMGYTKDCRTSIFSFRPAPIQVNYLGFPATMGVSYLDYILADTFLIPQQYQHYYAEKVVYLPDCFQANDDNRVSILDSPSRLAVGLPESGLVFCSFNLSHKISPTFFDCWMRILATVNDSVLWLVCDDLLAQQNLQNRASAFGINPQRLIFAKRLSSYPEHLARFSLADLFFDTLPFNAGTTASDALWVGVPVITCTGEAFASRMAGSLLTAMGLPELITDTLEDYENLAIKLANTPELLAQIRTKLIKNRHTSALFNTKRFCRHLETAYFTMWQKYQRGEAAAHFSVN